jgi:class 3 adenylate cyclase
MTGPDVVSQRSDLPTGVVTFLFSDIEGSTRLLQALGDRFPALLEQQARVMRSAIAAGDGIEVGTEGDSFFAVFSAPGGAIKAAVAAQRGLADAAWPTDVSVKVRIATWWRQLRRTRPAPGRADLGSRARRPGAHLGGDQGPLGSGAAR